MTSNHASNLVASAIASRDTDAQLSLLSLHWAHLDRGNKARLVRALVDLGGIKKNPLADRLECHHSVITNLYNVGGLDEALLSDLQKGKLSWKLAKQLGKEREDKHEPPAENTKTGAEAQGPGAEKITENAKERTYEFTTAKRIRTKDELVEELNIDLTEWHIKEWQVTKWEIGAAEKAKSIQLQGKKGNVYIGWQREDTRIVVEPLWRVKVILVPIKPVIELRKQLEALVEFWKKKAPVYKPVIRETRKPSGNMLEVNLPDLHLGKLAWAKETGYEDWDTDIAAQDFRKAVTELMARTASYQFDEILFVLGNDFQNTDNREGTTTAGTPVTTDTRYQKVCMKAHELAVWAIEQLRQVAPVKVVMVPGNHDTITNWWLGYVLEVQFAQCPDVTIDNSPMLRKYYEFGKVMLLLTHGDKGKRSNYPLLMATEQPAMWGRTVFHEAHTGDKHTTRVEEYNGVIVRILPALTPPDDWHSEMHFVGNSRAAQAMVWNRDEGLISITTYSMPKVHLNSLKAA